MLKAERMHLLQLGSESFANWKLGFEVKEDYSIEPYVAKVNGSWKVVGFMYDPKKNFFDPVTRELHIHCVVPVPGTWTITMEYRIKKAVD